MRKHLLKLGTYRVNYDSSDCISCHVGRNNDNRAPCDFFQNIVVIDRLNILHSRWLIFDYLDQK